MSFNLRYFTILDACSRGENRQTYKPMGLFNAWVACLSTAKQGDNRIGSVRPSVCLFVCMFVRALPAKPFDLRGSALPSAAKSKKESLPV